jgi:hypothetical protein
LAASSDDRLPPGGIRAKTASLARARSIATAIAAGHRDNGAPGERPIYHPGYYGAYVLDPSGHNVELVNHHR